MLATIPHYTINRNTGEIKWQITKKSSNMDEFRKTLGEPKEILEINFGHAKEILCRGLRYFIGESAKWLQGYDEIAKWMQDNDCKGLLLYGANGRGKSVMCYNILPTVFQYYLKQTKTFKCRANNLHLIQSDKTDYYSMLCAQVIFIDDFGTESITSIYGEKRDVFSDVVDIAEQEKKLLVLSTNLTPDEIRDRYGIRTLDRLRAITRAICLNGKSMRDNQVNANKQ